MRRFPSSAGFAIGPILFILALLAVIAAVIAAGGGGEFSSAGIMDRITADVQTQAELIRSKIYQCNMNYMNAVSLGGPASDNPYPASDPTNGTLVSALVCDPSGGASLWTDTQLPPPTAGFDDWYYMNAFVPGGNDGGRCIWTEPKNGGSRAVIDGLTRAASKFSSQEVVYNPSGSSQRFVIWITLPTGTPDSHCQSD